MRRHALVLGDRIAEAVAVVDEMASRCDDPAVADLLEAGAVGAGHLDFHVVRGMEGRVADLRRRSATTDLQEPLALAVAAAASAFANRADRCHHCRCHSGARSDAAGPRR